jgi:hypothetical protein
MSEVSFNLVNLLVLPVWACMILFPRLRFTQKLVTAYWYYLALAGLYLLFLMVAIVTAAEGFGFDFATLQRAVASEWGFVAVWTHLVIFDLFVGVWIFRDAKYWGVNPTWCLVLTFLAGPLGLAAYILWRQRKARNERERTLN